MALLWLSVPSSLTPLAILSQPPDALALTNFETACPLHARTLVSAPRVFRPLMPMNLVFTRNSAAMFLALIPLVMCLMPT